MGKVLCFYYLNNEPSIDYIDFYGFENSFCVSNYSLFKVAKWVI